MKNQNINSIQKWSFNEETRNLYIIYEKKVAESILNVRRNDALVRISIKPTNYGFHLQVKCGYLDKKYSIPGDYSLKNISYFISHVIQNSQISRTLQDNQMLELAVSDLLLETEIWYERGYMANPKTFPQEIFSKIPLQEFVSGGVKNYKMWMEKIFYSRSPFKSLSNDRIERFIENGEFPEKLHSIRHWNKFSLETLSYIVRYRAHSHRHWGVFCSQYADFYADIYCLHHEIWSEFDLFVKSVLKFPKVEKVKNAFRRIYNLEGTLKGTERLTTARQLYAYCEALAEHEEDKKPERASLLVNYIPPNINLPIGWLWADSKSFWTLGTKYSCCINSGAYSGALHNGEGAIAYRPDTITQLGGLAFFKSSSGKKWHSAEYRAYANGKICEEYEEDVRKIEVSLRGYGIKKQDTLLQEKKARAIALGKRQKPRTIENNV